MPSILEVKNISKKYGKKEVLKNLSFIMGSGQIIGLLGPNGAGKTTSFYIIVGFIQSRGGSIKLDGEELINKPMYKRARAGISYLPQDSSIFRKLSVEKNIKLVIQTRKGLSRSERKDLLERLISDFGLNKIRKQLGYTLSGGERRRTEIARALALEPKFLLLDEPFSGIDPKAIQEIKHIISKLKNEGIGVLLTDHNFRDTLEITDTSYIISEGEILVSGTTEELRSDTTAIDVYFGRNIEDDEW